MPIDLDVLCSQAEQAFATGQIDLAEKLCGQVLGHDTESPAALLLMGAILYRKGAYPSALESLQRVALISPDSAQVRLWLSRTLRRMGRNREAWEQAGLAVQFNGGDPALQHQLGLTSLDVKRFAEAVSAFQRAAAADPNAAQIQTGLGLALIGVGDRRAAIAALNRSLELAPNSLQALEALYQACVDSREPEKALECARNLVAIRPNVPMFHLALSKQLLGRGQQSEAEAAIQTALRLGIKGAGAMEQLGSLYQNLGRFQEADAQFRASIAALPLHGSAYLALAQNAKIGEADRPMVEQMRQVVSNPALSADQLPALHFALGKALEDLGEFQAAATHYDSANGLERNLKFGGREYNPPAYAARIDQIIQTFDEEFLRKPFVTGSDSNRPVFVVGMIRSGTTLVSQILSSHPDIGSAGERSYWLDQLTSLLEKGDDVADSADAYLDLLERIAPVGTRTIDKMPDNYLILPLLHQVFPRAKILHMVRDPADTCLSIYTTANRKKNDWAYDKESIAFVYRNYLRVMDRWRTLLPEGTFLDVRYEDLVQDRERVTREMLEFVGVEWNEACLSPEQNRGAVNTPSVWQARQPVYKSSVERWRKFEEWAEPFAPVGVDFSQAVRFYRNAVSDYPKSSVSHLGLGQALCGLGRHAEGVEALRRAAGLDPDSVVGLRSLVQCLLELGENREAATVAARLVALQPESADTHLLLARCLLLGNQADCAREEVDAAIRLGISSGPAAYMAGIVLQGVGRIGEAEKLFRQSIELDPRQGAAYAFLAQIESDPLLIDQMERVSRDPELPVAQRSLLFYGLGKGFEDLGDYETAMRRYDSANELSYLEKFGAVNFDRQSFLRNTANLTGAIESRERSRTDGVASNAPIFVVGMIRSGTTLVEQILSSHPEVGSAGEQDFWIRHGPEAALDDERIKPLAREYLARLQSTATGYRHIVDKMPMNYAMLPLIHRAFPNAKIIHVRRSPLDTCLSIYTTINPTRIEWLHDKANIVFAYRSYLEQMERWRRVLPKDTLLEVDYEELVVNPEQTTRRMIEFCSLDWSEVCLRPEANGRSVATPSVWQVRQPVYRSSVERWRRFEPWLGALEELRVARGQL